MHNYKWQLIIIWLSNFLWQYTNYHILNEKILIYWKKNILRDWKYFQKLGVIWNPKRIKKIYNQGPYFSLTALFVKRWSLSPRLTVIFENCLVQTLNKKQPGIIKLTHYCKSPTVCYSLPGLQLCGCCAEVMPLTLNTPMGNWTYQGFGESWSLGVGLAGGTGVFWRVIQIN